MTGEGGPDFFPDSDWLSGTELDLIQSWYLASVQYLDLQLGRLFDWLRRTSRAENTVLVIVADHGEYLGEHGLLKHMYFHFREALRVPMIVAGPGVPEGRVRTDFVSLIDIFDTLCDLTDIEPPGSTTGRSVFGSGERDAVFMENGVRSHLESYATHLSESRLDAFERGRKSIRTDEYLFTVDSTGQEHLYESPGDRPINDPAEATVDTLREGLRDALGDEFQQFGGYRDNLDTAVERSFRN